MQLFKTATFEMAFVVCFGGMWLEKMDRESDRDRLQCSHEAMPVKKKSHNAASCCPVFTTADSFN